MKEFSDQKIIESWRTNVDPWVTAIRANEIESRCLVTNKAIIDVVVGENINSVLDVGCGEGWLVRELNKVGISSLGVDVVSEFIASAQQKGGGRFKTISYEKLSLSELGEKFDLVVCNFSLLGNESVTGLFKKIPFLLNSGGSFIVQTIHPVVGCGDFSYKDGWREGSWAGFSSDFSDPAPWYFRTMETWKNLFLSNGFKIREIIEPLNPKTQDAASVIIIGVKDS